MINDIISSLRESFPGGLVDVPSSQEGPKFVTVKQSQLYDVLKHLKEMGFDHLSDVTAVDYIDDNNFEIIYHLWSHSLKRRLNVKMRISREEPTVTSVIRLWPGSQIHERKVHEMFGIVFEGNPDLSPLFLEDWEEIPPFRKDFDTREYVKRELEEVD